MYILNNKCIYHKDKINVKEVMDMKKEYTTPEVEKVEFNYREQVVASPDSCQTVFQNIGDYDGDGCREWKPVKPVN